MTGTETGITRCTPHATHPRRTDLIQYDALVTTKVPRVRRAAKAWRRTGRSWALARRRLPGMDDAFYLPLGDDRWRATCLLYTSDAADDLLCVDLGGRRIIKKK